MTLKKIHEPRYNINYIIIIAVITILTLFSGSLYSLRIADLEKNKLNHHYSEEIMDLERLSDATEKQISSGWGYLLFRDEDMLTQLQESKQNFNRYYNQLTDEISSPEGREYLKQVREAHQDYLEFFNLHLGKGLFKITGGVKTFQNELLEKRNKLTNTLTSFKAFKRNRLERLRKESITSSRIAWQVAIVLGASGALLVPLFSYLFFWFNQKQHETLQRLSFKEEWLGGMSHDLKNPIGTILLSSSMLEKYPEKEDSIKYINKIKIACQNMLDLISDSLSLTQIESGNLVLNTENFLVSEIVDSSLEVMSVQAQQNRTTLQKEIDHNFQINGDRQKLMRVLNNLISNAIKFSPEGKEIRLIVTHENGKARFCVEDHGLGIDEKDLPYIFDRFWQAKKTAHKGSGLGLAICKGIVEAHGGEIWVKSKQGVGSAFYFTLPIS